MVYWEQTAAFVSRFLSIIPHYSHLNWGLQQAILTPVSLLAMTKWREAGNISIGSKRPHLLMSLNYRQWIFHLTQLQVLESCQLHIGNSNIQSIFLERFWLIERNIFACATTYHLEPVIMNWMTMSFAYCLPRAWVFSGLLNSNCFSIFLFYCLELRCSCVSNLASPYIWVQSYLPSEWFLSSFLSSDIY